MNKKENTIAVALCDAGKILETLQHLNPEALNKKLNPRSNKPKDNQEQRTVRGCLDNIIETLKELLDDEVPEVKKLTCQNYTKINHDSNGNPRYYLPAYLCQEASVRELGGVKYRGKKYGAGWVFQTYNLESTNKILNHLEGNY